MSQNPATQRPSVEVPDSTAKLIMGMLVDAGIWFEYRRALDEPSNRMVARVSVAERQYATLLKIRDVVLDRQSRAQARPRAANPVEPDYKVPSGYELLHVKALNQWHWSRTGDQWLSGAYNSKELCVRAAWANSFAHIAAGK